MSYNPYTAALAALTNEQARCFYAETAIEHSFLTFAAAAITAKHTIEAGKAFRQFHDSQLVPFTLLAVATVVEFFVKPEPVEVEIVSQPALPGFTPVALLPGAQPRTLITPCISENRVLITPAPADYDDLGWDYDVTGDDNINDNIDDVVLIPLSDALQDLSVRELQRLAKDKGVKNASRKSKAQLIEALLAA